MLLFIQNREGFVKKRSLFFFITSPSVTLNFPEQNPCSQNGRPLVAFQA